MTYALGVASGVAARPVYRFIMGCFKSKPEFPVASKPYADRNAPAAVQTPTTMPMEIASAPVAVSEPVRQPVTLPRVEFTEWDQVVARLKNHRDTLEDLLDRSEREREEDLKDAAMHYRAGRKQMAGVLLRRRKLAKERAEDAISSLNHIDEMLAAMDRQKSTASIMEAMDQSTKALNKLRDVVSVERVQQTVNDFQEQKAHVRRVQEVLNTQLTDDDYLTEEDMQHELDIYNASVASEAPATGAAVAQIQKTPAAPEEDATIAAISSVEPTPTELPPSAENISGDVDIGKSDRLVKEKVRRPAEKMSVPA